MRGNEVCMKLYLPGGRAAQAGRSPPLAARPPLRHAAPAGRPRTSASAPPPGPLRPGRAEFCRAVCPPPRLQPPTAGDGDLMPTYPRPFTAPLSLHARERPPTPCGPPRGTAPPAPTTDLLNLLRTRLLNPATIQAAPLHAAEARGRRALASAAAPLTRVDRALRPAPCARPRRGAPPPGSLAGCKALPGSIAAPRRVLRT